MKYSLFVMFLAVNLFADSKPGSKCGLTDSKDDAWKETKSISLTDASNSRINNLPTLVKQQLIIAAKEFADFGEGSNVIKNTVDAVNYLRANSDANTLSVVYYNVKRLKVTEVLHYPGDNPNAAIFLTGTRTIIAYNGDDSITCR